MTFFSILLILIVTLILTAIYFTIRWRESRQPTKKRRSTWTSR